MVRPIKSVLEFDDLCATQSITDISSYIQAQIKSWKCYWYIYFAGFVYGCKWLNQFIVIAVNHGGLD